ALTTSNPFQRPRTSTTLIAVDPISTPMTDFGMRMALSSGSGPRGQGYQSVLALLPKSLLNDLVDLENGQEYRQSNKPDYRTHHQNHQWLDEGGQALYTGLDLRLERIRHAQQHILQLAAFLSDG